jgi:hypothetical protein
VICEQGALVFEETQQVGHLLEIGRHVRIVAAEMDIVELDIDDALDAVVELAAFLPVTPARPLARVFVGRRGPGRRRRHVAVFGCAGRLGQRDGERLCCR